MSGVRCPMCDYDIDDCECEDRWGSEGKHSSSIPATEGLFEQMNIGASLRPPSIKYEYECQDCIGMKEHGCYCMAMGAKRPGGS